MLCLRVSRRGDGALSMEVVGRKAHAIARRRSRRSGRGGDTSENQADVPELVSEVACFCCMPPRLPECSVICERAQETKMALGRIVNAGQNPIHDAPPEMAADPEVCFACTRHEPASMLLCAAFKRTHHRRSHGDDPTLPH